jgi:dihydrofolate reductase
LWGKNNQKTPKTPKNGKDPLPDPYVTELRQGAAGTIYGRKTYQIMESYWPNVPKMPDLPQWQQDYAEWVNKALKVVVSKTLSGTTWNNDQPYHPGDWKGVF